MRLLGIIKPYLLTALVGICSAQDSVDVASNTVIFDRDPRWLQLSDSGNHPIKVIVDDQVEDGCWTNSVSAANAVKLELKRSGFDVTPTNEDSFPHHLVIMALGYSNGSSSCLIYYNLQFDMIDVKDRNFGLDKHKVSSIMYTKIYSKGGILSGGSTNSRLKTTFVELTQAFLLDISKYQEETLEKVKKNASPEAKQFWESYELE